MKKEVIEEVNTIGKRASSMLILSGAALIWLYEYAIIWKIFLSLLFFVVTCAIIAVKLEFEEDETNP